MNDPETDADRTALPAPEELAETLLDAAAEGNFAAELARAQASIDRIERRIDPIDLFRYRVLFFDLAMVSTANPDLRQETASRLLTSAIEIGGTTWATIRTSNRLDEIERLALTSRAGVELLELLAYAPDPGLRTFAVSSLESAGMRALDGGEDSRSFERLLHAIGANEDAYRLESARKQRLATLQGHREDVRPADVRLEYRMIAIAGGHAQLRGTAALLLQRHGIGTVLIPSSREAVRRERDIVLLLQGCDLAFMLVRQITHSTSDQVRKAAERLGVPVVYSNALSAVAIERQLFERGR